MVLSVTSKKQHSANSSEIFRYNFILADVDNFIATNIENFCENEKNASKSTENAVLSYLSNGSFKSFSVGFRLNWNIFSKLRFNKSATIFSWVFLKFAKNS